MLVSSPIDLFSFPIALQTFQQNKLLAKQNADLKKNQFSTLKQPEEWEGRSNQSDLSPAI